MQSPDIRPSGGLLSSAASGNTQALLSLLGQLKATSSQQAQPATVVNAQPLSDGNWRVTVELQGLRFTLTAPLPPATSPLQIYRQNGQLRVAADARGHSNTSAPIRTLSELLSAMPQTPSPAASILQQAISGGGFAAWASVFAQFSQPENIKRWVEANQNGQLLKQMAEHLPDTIKDRMQQVQEHRQLQGAEDQRQQLQAMRFDVPLPLGERWVNGEACLKRASKARDHWHFELIFDLPTAGRIIATADIRPAALTLSLSALQTDTRLRLGALTPLVEQRLRQAGLNIGPIQIMQPQAQPLSEARLDIHV